MLGFHYFSVFVKHGKLLGVRFAYPMSMEIDSHTPPPATLPAE